MGREDPKHTIGTADAVRFRTMGVADLLSHAAERLDDLRTAAKLAEGRPRRREDEALITELLERAGRLREMEAGWHGRTEPNRHAVGIEFQHRKGGA